jgi:uncharacterized protein
MNAMERDQIIDQLKKHASDLRTMGVQSLALFGSVARGDETPDSDVDILVSFSVPITFDTYFNTKIYLEDLIGRRVDLGTLQTLRARARPYVEKDAVYVLA